MMFNPKKYFVGFAAVSVCCLALANESSTLLVSKNGNALDFELLNENAVAGLQFEVALTGASKNSIDISACTSSLPSTHTGACKFANGVLKVVVYSTTNATLTSGPIGSIVINGSENARYQVKNLLLGNAQGQALQGEAMLGVDSGDNWAKPVREFAN